jgi:hypothetical protein
MLLSANLATPLYVGYSAQFGISTAILALILAIYALVLIPSLLVFGQLSDRFGRRRVIGAGLGLAVVALVLFALAENVSWLFAARGTQGLAQGMMSGAATAALAELNPGWDGGRRCWRHLRSPVVRRAGHWCPGCWRSGHPGCTSSLTRPACCCAWPRSCCSGWSRKPASGRQRMADQAPGRSP